MPRFSHMGLVEVLLASAVRHGPYPPWYTFRFGIFPIFLYIPLYSVGAAMVVAYSGIYWNIGNIANMKPAGGRHRPLPTAGGIYRKTRGFWTDELTDELK